MRYTWKPTGTGSIRFQGPGLDTSGIILSVGGTDDALDFLVGMMGQAFDAGVLQGQANVYRGPQPVAEAVNPNHYKVGGIECIDYLKAKLSAEELRGFLKGNAIKYLSRAEHKGNAEDYAKANWYTTMLSGKDPRNA